MFLLTYYKFISIVTTNLNKPWIINNIEHIAQRFKSVDPLLFYFRK